MTLPFQVEPTSWAKPLQIALIGAGWVTRERITPALNELCSSFTVVAVADPDFERRNYIGDVFNVPQQCRHENHESLLSEVECDVAIVTVPTMLHEPVVMYCLHKQIPTLCEKPLAASTESCLKLLAEARRQNVGLSVVHNYIYEQPFAQMIELCREGIIGQPFLVRSETLDPAPWAGLDEGKPLWRSSKKHGGGGCLLDQGYHWLYLSEAFLGSLIVRLSASIGRWGTVVNDVEDLACVLLETATGATASIQTSWCVPARGRAVIEVHGTKGSIAVEYAGHTLALYLNEVGAWQGVAMKSESKHNAYKLLLWETLTALFHTREPLEPAKHSVRLVKLIETCYQYPLSSIPQ